MPLTKRKRESEPEKTVSPVIIPFQQCPIKELDKASAVTDGNIKPSEKQNLFNPVSTTKSQLEIDKEIFTEFFETDDEEYDPSNPNDYEKVKINLLF